MYTKIACVLIIVAILIFGVMFTFFDKGYNNILRALICMGAIALIVVLGDVAYQ